MSDRKDVDMPYISFFQDVTDVTSPAFPTHTELQGEGNEQIFMTKP